MLDMEIKIGEYIVIQKQNYRKLVKLNKANLCINLGKDNIDLTGIKGCKYSSIFKIVPKTNKKNRDYYLELTGDAVELKNEIDVKSCGMDNRNIVDDGHSQKLTATEIEDLKSDANKASDIVETLISHSNTFHNKTEYSQEKYLKKKEKKYFEYLQILKPNLRLISDIMYKLDSGKIQGIRIDTLSQIISLSNINSEGTHLLYDSGSNGLIAAALLSTIGSLTNGKLVHMHPGNMSQKQALLAMNFPEEQLSRCISVNIYSVLRLIYQGTSYNEVKNGTCNAENYSHKRKAEEVEEHANKVAKTGESLDVYDDTESKTENSGDNSFPEPKKPKWHFDNITASELLDKKLDSLVIACKEDPQNLFNELVRFIKPGRPFVIYYSVAEPLQNLYITLKSQSNVAALKLTCNWMRNYQILPERTHPEVMMDGAGGFLLTGYVLK